MTVPSSPSVGIAGMGIIGSRVASSLRSRGFSVHVWNRTERSDLEG
jgi:3-hydroxyisobutyrate dehydrogenase-like beta-hydroxyacid dehydrogenase